MPAYGNKSGRRIAWLLYGNDKRLGDVRGTPILSLALQYLKEIDRYRASVQRKAVINSMLAMFIQKDQDKPGTRPFTGGATKKTDIENAAETYGNTERRSFNVQSIDAPFVIDEMQVGEKPVAFGADGTDLSFPQFESAIIGSVAWGIGIPPENLEMRFSSNYSASQAANNEFTIILNLVKQKYANQFCQPIYVDWFISQVLMRKIDAPGFLDALRNSNDYDIYGAWISTEWSGSIKPSVDIKKTAQGYKLLEEEGWITNEKASRQITGTSWRKNIKQLKKENTLKVEALRPLLELQKEFGKDIKKSSIPEIDIDTLNEDVIELITDNGELLKDG